MAPAPSTPRRRRSFIARLSLALSLFILLVLALGAYVILVRPSELARFVTERALPRVSEALGRPVTVEDVHARILPNPAVRIRGLTVAGGPGEPPLIHAPQAEVGVALWPLLRSFGKEVEVSSLRLEDTALNLVHRPDGTWSYEDLGKNNAPSPPTPSNNAPSRSLHIETLEVVNARVQVTDLAAGRHATLPVTRIGIQARDIEVGKPLRVDLSAALGAQATNMTARVELQRLPASKAELEASGYPVVSGTLGLHKVPLEQLRAYFPAKLASLVKGGELELSAQLSTPEGGGRRRYALDGTVQLDRLTLRSHPAKGGLAFNVRVDPLRPKAAVLAVRDLSLAGPGLQLGGSVDATLSPMAVSFDLRGPLLDLDQLLGAFPEKAPQSPAPAAAEPGPLLSGAQRSRISSAQVNGKLALDKVTRGALSAEQLKANVALDRGVLTVKQGSAQLYSGSVALDGTRVDLTPATPRWMLQAKLDGLDLAAAFSALSDSNPLKGRLSGQLSVAGAGHAWDDIREQLTGRGTVGVKDGALTSTDLGATLASSLATGLKALKRPGAAGVVNQAAQGTQLKDLEASFTVRDGWLELTRPLAVQTAIGALSLDGRIGLDQRLDLRGRALLSPDFVATALGGVVRPQAPVDVPLQLGGTLTAPRVTGVDSAALAKSALRLENAPAPVREKAKALEEQIKSQARRGLGGLLDRVRK